jgi:hypothetical protein
MTNIHLSVKYLYQFIWDVANNVAGLNFYFILDCGTPVVENGKVDITFGTLLNNSLTVACDEGYNISGDSTWTCADSGWDSSAICVIQG